MIWILFPFTLRKSSQTDMEEMENNVFYHLENKNVLA